MPLPPVRDWQRPFASEHMQGAKSVKRDAQMSGFLSKKLPTHSTSSELSSTKKVTLFFVVKCDKHHRAHQLHQKIVVFFFFFIFA